MSLIDKNDLLTQTFEITSTFNGGHLASKVLSILIVIIVILFFAEEKKTRTYDLNHIWKEDMLQYFFLL